ncbi:hypothetical protein AB1Y20_004608 [Prymnesium parvum]|uniref:USP domain-containing protein n=1 Tax=Prymnesium parvum TaxID=97485 RepID=A0AB34IWX0_PRYPA
MARSLLLLLLPSLAAARYLGLRNQGNTCYMNSLLQVLHHLPQFRSSVYDMPTSINCTAEEWMPLELQRVFFELEHGSEYGVVDVGTERLTKSFGWGPEDVLVQQDVHEFSRMLCEALQARLQQWGRRDCVSALFEGTISSVTRCTKVDFTSEKVERFCDLQMQVHGCSSLQASLREFVREQVLSGPNAYNTRREDLGRQEARRGVRFKTLPPVLLMHLKRFDYDVSTGDMRKLQSEFKFPTLLRLHRFMRERPAQGDPSPTYVLYGVLSHVGGAGCGHYVSYVRPLGQRQWYEFDDTRVRPVLEEVAVRRQFGGGHSQGGGMLGMGAAPNAYMLVYVRQEEALKATEVDEGLLPSDVRKHFEQSLRRRRKR